MAAPAWNVERLDEVRWSNGDRLAAQVVVLAGDVAGGFPAVCPMLAKLSLLGCLVQWQCTVLHRLGHVGQHRQVVVLQDYGFQGCRQAVGVTRHDEGNRLAHVADHAISQ